MRLTALIRSAGLTGLLASAAVAAPAEAVTTVGNNLAQKPAAGLKLCDGKDTTCTVVPSTLAGERQAPGGLVAVAGVVVRWRVRSETAQPSTIALRVVRGTTGLERSAYQSLSTQAPPIFTFPTRIPVAAGDRLGVDLVVNNGVNPVIAAPAATTAAWQRWEPALNVNESRPPTDQKPFELLLNADIEADADVDGWGDETQDACVGTAGPDGGCPLPVPPPPPPPPPGAGQGPSGAGGPASTPTGTAPGSSGQTPGGAFGAAPRITGLRFDATRVRFRISERATVTLRVQRVLPGRSVRGRCVRPTRRNRRARSCIRLVTVLTGRTTVQPGFNTARLRRLPPGRYRVRLISAVGGREAQTISRYFRLRT